MRSIVKRQPDGRSVLEAAQYAARLRANRSSEYSKEAMTAPARRSATYPLSRGHECPLLPIRTHRRHPPYPKADQLCGQRPDPATSYVHAAPYQGNVHALLTHAHGVYPPIGDALCHQEACPAAVCAQGFLYGDLLWNLRQLPALSTGFRPHH